MRIEELANIPSGSILGLHCSGLHDSAIAVVGPDGQARFAVALERLSRRKKDGRWPQLLLDQVPWSKVRAVAVSALPFPQAQALQQEFAVGGWPLRIGDAAPGMGRLAPQFDALLATLPVEVLRFDHHECHAASAYHLSSFDRALTVTCDAGAANCPWFAAAYDGDGDELRLLGGLPGGSHRSPANLYTVVTAILGLQPNNHEGKVTGLAAHGSADDRMLADFETRLWPMVQELGELMQWHQVFQGDQPGVLAVNRHRLQAFREQLRDYRDADLAACVQQVCERHALSIVRRARELCDRPHEALCLAGGLFSNVRINQRLIAEFDAGFVAPPMTDDGTALGAALLAVRRCHPQASPRQRRATMFLGPTITAAAAQELLGQEELQANAPADLVAATAALLAQGKTVAVARGAMEFGPRALGHRSILCRPTDKGINDWLNKQLCRTEYMPFAPMSPVSESRRFYRDARCVTHFMTVTVDCTEAMAAQCPAVVHVDGTARPQLVDPRDEPFVAGVLQALAATVGCGTVLNTSFNMHEEPIVANAADALQGFAQARLDALVLGDSVLLRAGNEERLDAIAARARSRRDPNIENLALSTWLSRTQDQLQELRQLKSTWFDPELQRLNAEVERLQADAAAAGVHAELAVELRQKDAEVRRLTTDLSRLQGSLTWKLNRVFDTLRRGDLKGLAGHVRGFLGYRLGSALRRLVPRKRSPVQQALQRLARPPRDVPPLPELRERLTALLPPTLPTVTAVVPCFDYGRLVQQAVDSLRRQSYPALEIVVVDDGSTDPETLAALAELEQHSTVRVVHQPNQGLVGARMAGAAAATGELLLFLDNDDLLEPEAIALLAAHLVADAGAAFAYPAQHFFGDEELVWEPQDYNAYDLLWSNHPTVCSMVRAADFRAVSGYDRSMQFGWEDWEHWIALAAGQRFGRSVPVPVFRHRRHGKTMTHTAAEKGAQLRAAILGKHQALYAPASITALKRRWRPAVSVVIPFCNAHRWWDETLQSLLRQTFDDFEIVLVNDASDAPESLTLLEQLRQRSDLRVVDRQQRGDLSAARNTGVRAARGEFVFFLDPDDLLAPTALEQLCWLLLDSPDVGFAYTGVVHFGEQSGVCIDAYDVERLKRENFLTSAAMIRRDVYLQVGGMEEQQRLLFEDYDFWLRLAALGIHGKLLPEPLFFYRRHGSGRSAWVRERLSDTEMLKLLRQRNPGLWGDSAELPPHYRPLPQGEPDALATLTADLGERYRQDLRVPYDAYRRPNVPNPLPARHWDDPRVHVLYFVPNTTIGGAENIDLDILHGLDATRFSVTMVVEYADNAEWRERFERAVAELIVLPHVVTGPAATAAFLDYLLISRNIDVVFNRNTFVGYRQIQSWSRHRQVRCCDLIHVHNRGEDWCRGSRPTDHHMHRRFLTSHDLRLHMAREYDLDHDRFAVVYCGVDTTAWSPTEVPAGTLRRLIGADDDAPLVGFVGRLHEQKDPLRWLRTAEQMGATDPAAAFVMIGDGPDAAAVNAAHRSSPLRHRIHLLGHRENVRSLVRDLDLLLLTSRYEGLPQVVFECMSLGVPVVSTDTGGTRECVGNGLGEVVPIDASPAVLAAAAARWLQRRSDPVLRQACRDRIVRRYDLRVMQDTYARELSTLAASCDRAARLREYQDLLMQRSLL